MTQNVSSKMLRSSMIQNRKYKLKPLERDNFEHDHKADETTNKNLLFSLGYNIYKDIMTER